MHSQECERRVAPPLLEHRWGPDSPSGALGAQHAERCFLVLAKLN